LEHRHECAGTAAELENPTRWQLVLQECSEPMEAPLRQIRSRPGQDVWVAQVALLVREPVFARVEPYLVIGHTRDVRARHLTPHQCFAPGTSKVPRRKRDQLRVTTP